MSVKNDEFNDRDEQAAWELLGRHQSVGPSFGFAERTLRRLREKPARPASVLTAVWQPAWRIAAAAVIAVAGVALWFQFRPATRPAGDGARAILIVEPEIETYAKVQNADYLEDFDVIASLDQLDAKGSAL
jgi:anti-sigma-K factor RskA